MADGGGRKAAALVVGVGEYPAATVPPLAYAAADAEAVADALKSVCLFPADKVEVLVNETATRANIIDRLMNWLPSAAAGADLVFLYFAGHGVTLTDGDRSDGYFLPHQVDPANPAAEGVGMAFVAQRANGLPAASVVLCLDCCYAGAAVTARGPGAVARDLAVRPTALEPLFAGRTGRYVWTACDDKQSSFEATEFKHGVFTHFLLEGLDTADDARGAELDELFNTVAEQVTAFAAARAKQQTPRCLVNKSGRVFLVERRLANNLTFVPSGVSVGPADDPLTAVGELVRRLAATTAPAELVKLLHQLGRKAQPPAGPDVVRVAVPVAFAYLTDPANEVKAAAHRVVQAVGVTRSFATVAELARQPASVAFTSILRGLNVLKAQPELVTLLDRLTDDLSGELLRQAHEVLEQKRLSLGLAELAELFRQQNSKFPPRKVLGHGLFAAAYLAEHAESRLPVVVRVLREPFAALHDVRTQFLALSRAAMRMKHQGLVTTLDVGRLPDQHVYYVVRDHVDGVTLKDMLAGGYRFTQPQVVGVLRQVFAALEVVHEFDTGHGGVKPSNVFLCKRERVVLGDLTPAPRGMGPDVERRLTYDHRYVAPEVRPEATLGPKADVYAAGCLAFELLTGRPPFVGDDHHDLVAEHRRTPVPRVTELRPDLGPRADEYLIWLLTKGPTDRPDATQALARVDELLAGPTASPLPPPPSAGGLLTRPSEPPLPPPVEPKRRPGPFDFSPVWPAGPAEPPTPPEAVLRDMSIARFQPAVSMMSLGDSRPVNTDPGTVVRPAAPDSLTRTAFGADHDYPHSAPISAGDRPVSVPGYDIEGVIGRGGMGVVYKARQHGLNRPVALKMLLGGIHSSDQARTRFRIEAEAVAAIRHPNVVQVYDYGEHDGLPYIAFEFLTGDSLAQRLNAGPLTAYTEAATVVLKIARGIGAGHAMGIIHRDVKPHNVLFDDDGQPKVVDFGLARREGANELTNTGALVGTAAYMAPEQATGMTRSIGPATDVFGLGSLFYECLTGRSPFRGESAMETVRMVIDSHPPPVRSLVASVPRGLEAICLKCLEKDPARRYPTANEMADDLDRFLRGEPVAARPPGFAARFGKWVRCLFRR